MIYIYICLLLISNTLLTIWLFRQNEHFFFLILKTFFCSLALIVSVAHLLKDKLEYFLVLLFKMLQFWYFFLPLLSASAIMCHNCFMMNGRLEIIVLLGVCCKKNFFIIFIFKVCMQLSYFVSEKFLLKKVF